MASVSARGMTSAAPVVARRADRAEDVGDFVALILRLAWARASLRPLVDEAVLLADPRLILT